MRKFVLINAFVIFFLLISFYFDKRMVIFISTLRNALLTDLFTGIAFVSSILIVFIFLTLLFVKERRRKWILPLWVTLVVDVVISFLLKLATQRLRPFEFGLVPLVQGIEETSRVLNSSFPSFQAMMVFSAIPFLSKEFPKFKYVWIIFACLVAFSRVYLGMHFLSDVIAGGLIGYIAGYLIMKNTEN